MKRTVYPKPFKEHIERLAKYCLETTAHGEYELKIHYAQEAHKDDTDVSETKAEVALSCSYLWVSITVFPCLLTHWRAGEYREIGRNLLHEVCHLLTEPISDLFMADAAASQRSHFTSVIERQTCRVANALDRLMPEGWHLPNPMPKAKQPPQAVQLAPEGVSIDKP
jgi:hypothetical protein